MADNISVKITADVVDLQSQFAVARSESSALTQELNKLARQAASTGLTDELKGQLDAAAEAMLQAKARTADLSAQLKEAQGSSSAMAQDLDKDAALVDRAFVRMAAAAAAYKAIDLVDNSIEYAASIQHMSEVLGISGDDLQAFYYAMRQTGGTTDEADTILRRFMANLGGAADGTLPQAEKAIEAVGLTVDELQGSPTAALQKLAAGILAVKDPTEQARLEMELAGRSGEDLRPVLEALAGGFDAMKEKAQAAGQVLDADTRKGAEDAEIAISNAKTAIEGLLAEGVVDWAHAAGEAFDWLAPKAEALGRAFASIMGAPVDKGAPTSAPDWLKSHQGNLPSTAGGLGLDMQTPQMPEVTPPTIESEGQANKTAEIARRLSDAIAQAAEQLALKQISAAESANNFELQMGQESLEQWKAKAVEEADAKYNAELTYLQRKAAADKGNVVEEQKDLDQIKALHQEHANALQEIDQQYAQKKQQVDREELQEFLSAENAKLQDALRTLNAEFSEHKISADQRYQLEQQLTNEIYGEELKRLDVLLATLTQGTKAYEDAIKEREKVEQEFTKQSIANTNQLETQEAQKWTQLGNSIKSSFNSALDGMLFEGKTFGQGMLEIAEGIIKAFLNMGETIAENWIETQIASMFETKTTQGTTALGEVSDAAAVAGANAYAAYAAMPPVAAAMAADAVSTTMGFASLIALETGTNYVPRDMPAFLHRGEAVIPARYNNTNNNSSDVALNYSPTINSREPATLGQMLQTHGHEMHAWIRREFRNGALRA
ncbi:MAG TPA: hypothetical protein VKR31_00860 [Rhizomicrobium sp.]|nr:hypothetical protein [Rhizomicrobium sp.]